MKNHDYGVIITGEYIRRIRRLPGLIHRLGDSCRRRQGRWRER